MEQYYWIATHKVTGEIAEKSTPYKSIDDALRAGRKFVEETWSVYPGEASVEVYTEPYHSQKSSRQLRWPLSLYLYRARWSTIREVAPQYMCRNYRSAISVTDQPSTTGKLAWGRGHICVRLTLLVTA